MIDRAASIPSGRARRPRRREPLVEHYRPLGIPAVAAAAARYDPTDTGPVHSPRKPKRHLGGPESAACRNAYSPKRPEP
jgi:hypothetical protein